MVEYVSAILSKAGHHNAEQAAADIMAFETQIADAQLSRVESRNAEKMYNKRSVAEVKAMLKKASIVGGIC